MFWDDVIDGIIFAVWLFTIYWLLLYVIFWLKAGRKVAYFPFLASVTSCSGEAFLKEGRIHFFWARLSMLSWDKGQEFPELWTEDLLEETSEKDDTVFSGSGGVYVQFLHLKNK